MSDLIDTAEMYLRTIYELIEDGVTPMRARIAEQLGHAGPTVSQTIARMQRDGLVVVSGDRHLELTAEGEAIAVRVMRKHRLSELLLTEVVGLELRYVHEEACRWEHVMSDRVEKRVFEMLGHPHVSPYGNPIPGLAELFEGEESPEIAPGVSLLQIISEGVTEVSLVRIGENPQAAEGFLDESTHAGLIPGAMLKVAPAGDDVLVTADNGTITIGREAARHVFVVAR